jgi:hypothetical protein
MKKFLYKHMPHLDFYKTPSEWHRWQKCPVCKSRPKIWTFDNGRFASCQCGNNTYDRLNVRAESIMSHVRRTNSLIGYRQDALRKAWNRYITSGYMVFNIQKGVNKW